MAAKAPDGKPMEACKFKLSHFPSKVFFFATAKRCGSCNPSGRVQETRCTYPRAAQQISFLDINTGLNVAQFAAQSQLWRQEQLQTEQAVSDGEAIAEHQLMDEAVSAHQDSVQPLRVESPTRARLRTHNKAPYDRENRVKSHQPEGRFRAQGSPLGPHRPHHPQFQNATPSRQMWKTITLKPEALPI